MTKFRTILFSCACLFGTVALFTSCEENEQGVTPGSASSIAVPNELNAVVVKTVTFESDWEVVDKTDTWYTVSPMSGSAGTVDLEITVQDVHTGLMEREGNFMVVSGADEGTLFYVIQDGFPGFSQDVFKAGISGDAQDYAIAVEGNVEFEVVSDADWFKVGEITSESTLLSDGVTLSKYRTYYINITAQANEGEETRTAILTLTSEEGPTATVEFSQIRSFGEVEYTRDFLRRSLVMRFTGNWCGWCPNMNHGIVEAAEKYADHIVPVNMYQGSGALSFPDINTYMNQFGISGFPTAVMNYYAMINNMQPYSVITNVVVDAAEEAVASLPAKTAIAGVVQASETSFDVNVNIACKEAGEYFVTAFILEDGIIGTQADYVEGTTHTDYEHNAVNRAVMTDYLGDSYRFEANSSNALVMSLATPTNIRTIENAHVVVIVSYRGNFKGEVASGALSYREYGYIVDNVVDIPANGVVDFSYEE